MNKKTLSIVAIVIIAIIVVAAVGVYLATQGGGDGGDGTTPDVAGASSLQFSVDLTSGGESLGTYKYMVKNAGTSSMMIRVEITSSEGDLVYTVNGAQQKAWGYVAGEWQDFFDTFSAQWDSWGSTWEGDRENLEG